MSYDYQVAVLGAGPGGYEAAIRASQYGLKTVLIEARELGGTCLNRGCIPTKALLHGAEVWETVNGAKTFGVRVEGATLDYAALASFKDRQVSKLRKGIEALEKAHGVTVVNGFGVLEDEHTIAVGDSRITAESIIIATGSEPVCPQIKGAEHALNSDDVLQMTELPSSAVIVGGGVIGIEFATLLSTLGCRVTVLEMLPDILPGIDGRLTDIVRKTLKKKKTSIITEAKVLEITAESVVKYEANGEQYEISADMCVMCVGRRPLTSGIGLERIGVKTERGYIVTDEHMRTSVENIFAIGDITGKQQLAHVASAQGLVAAANCAGRAETMDYRVIPACVYTSPEIACVGFSEQSARESGYEVKVGSFDVAGNGRSSVMNERSGLALIVCDAKTDGILGVQIMSPRATDMIAEAAVAMKAGATVGMLASTIHPHPTVSEIVMEAAHDAEGLCCHSIPKQR